MTSDPVLTSSLLTIITAVTLGSFVKGALGFGLPLIATPILLFVMPLPETVAVLALPIAVANLQQIWLNRANWRIIKQFWPLILVSSLVMLVGSAAMVVIDNSILAMMIGGMISSHAILSMVPIRALNTQNIATERLRKLIIPAGLISGILGSLTSMYSFPSLQLFLTMRLDKNDLAFLLGVFLSLGFVALWLGIRHAGFPVGDNLILSLLMVIPALIAQKAGDMTRRRISDDGFRKLVHISLACGGVTLIVRNLLDL